MVFELLIQRAMLFTVCIFLFSGCTQQDPNKASVSGMVTFNGEPIADGSISFIPTDGNGGPSAGGSILAGKYSIAQSKGPMIGMNRVEIVAVRETGKMVSYGAGPEMPERISYIPAKYNEVSELTEDLKQGHNEIHFELSDVEQ